MPVPSAVRRQRQAHPSLHVKDWQALAAQGQDLHTRLVGVRGGATSARECHGIDIVKRH
jgi:hypothetical protein